MYPKDGKKRAEIKAWDVERLHGCNFLNDNLIGFYIRFLEHHLERTDAELAKKVYFFNSYFFASLTGNTKGAKQIDYQAVERWTLDVDIFSYDYIVVPINEDTHWYMAIICNLPSLIRSISEDRGTENISTEEPQGEAEKNEKAHPPQSAAVTSGEELACDARRNFPTLETTLPVVARKKEHVSSTKKNGPRQPVIITFDSLGTQHRQTIGTLREYIREEGKSKQSLIISSKNIKGMTANGIPQQPNSFDCGLYVLAYLEKFIQNPDGFVTKLLQKKMHKYADWPMLRSELLRQSLQNFLLNLYDEQYGKDGADAERPLIVDTKPLNILLSQPRSSHAPKEAESLQKRESKSGF